MLIACDGQKEVVLAKNAKRGEPYFCPACHEPVVLKKGQLKLSHFAHHSGSHHCQESFSEGETYEHLLGKLLLAETLGPECRLEVFLPGLQQRPDVLWGRQAWEFQCSPLPFWRFCQRSQHYQQEGFTDVWLLGEKLWPKKNLSPFHKGALRLVKGQWQLWGIAAKCREAVVFVPSNWHYQTGVLLTECRQPLAYLCSPHVLKVEVAPQPTWSVAGYQQQLQQLLTRQDPAIMKLQGHCYRLGRHIAWLPEHCYEDSVFFFYFGHQLLVLRALSLTYQNWPEWRQAVAKLSLSFPFIQLSLEAYLLEVFLEGQAANKKQILGDLAPAYDKLRRNEDALLVKS